MRWIFCLVSGLAVFTEVQGQQPFELAPAFAIEAEDFTIEKGWKVVKNGEGNYMVDIVPGKITSATFPS